MNKIQISQALNPSRGEKEGIYTDIETFQKERIDSIMEIANERPGLEVQKHYVFSVVLQLGLDNYTDAQIAEAAINSILQQISQ